MATIDIREYHRIQRQRLARLARMKRRGPITAAKYMATKVRSMAPRKTGRLISSIRRSKNQVRIGGTDPRTGFPYVHWINQTPGYEVLNVRRYTDRRGVGYVWIRGNWVPVYGKIMVYGQAPANWVWTGTARFVTIARNSARQKFRNIMLRETRKALTLSG